MAGRHDFRFEVRHGTSSANIKALEAKSRAFSIVARRALASSSESTGGEEILRKEAILQAPSERQSNRFASSATCEHRLFFSKDGVRFNLTSKLACVETSFAEYCLQI